MPHCSRSLKLLQLFIPSCQTTETQTYTSNICLHFCVNTGLEFLYGYLSTSCNEGFSCQILSSPILINSSWKAGFWGEYLPFILFHHLISLLILGPPGWTPYHPNFFGLDPTVLKYLFLRITIILSLSATLAPWKSPHQRQTRTLAPPLSGFIIQSPYLLRALLCALEEIETPESKTNNLLISSVPTTLLNQMLMICMIQWFNTERKLGHQALQRPSRPSPASIKLPLSWPKASVEKDLWHLPRSVNVYFSWYVMIYYCNQHYWSLYYVSGCCGTRGNCCQSKLKSWGCWAFQDLSLVLVVGLGVAIAEMRRQTPKMKPAGTINVRGERWEKTIWMSSNKVKGVVKARYDGCGCQCRELGEFW